MVEQTQLANGLTIVTDCIDTVETVAVGVWVAAGTRHERAEFNGVAHMLEHMAFKGTHNRTAQDIAQTIENVGGYLNAGTSRESTAYYARMLKNDLHVGIELLADILQNSVFAEDEFERERSVVLQEIGQSHDAPDDIIFDYFQETAFPKQAMGRSILGTNSIVHNMNRETLVQYRDHFYSAPRMILAAAGNVSHDELLKRAEMYFDHLPTNGKVEVEPASYVGGDFRMQRDLEQVHVLMGFKGRSIKHDDNYAVALLATILGGGMSSRLFQEVREKRGLVYSIYAFKSAYSDSGMFGIYAGTAPNQVPQLLPIVCYELVKATENLTDEEITRSRTQLKASLMMGLESTTARCEHLAQQILNFGKHIPTQDIIAKIDAVSKDDLYRVAQDVFSSKLTFVATGPIGEVEVFERIEERLPSVLSSDKLSVVNL
ncbi:MAG: pitrilysin family protein [Pseudomonadota bacterium]